MIEQACLCLWTSKWFVFQCMWLRVGGAGAMGRWETEEAELWTTCVERSCNVFLGA